MNAMEWKEQHDSLGMMTFSRSTVEKLIGQLGEYEAEVHKWWVEADGLRIILESMNETFKREHSERDLLYSVIEDNFFVEDWHNPDKGITEIEAYINAVKTKECPECPL